MIKDLDLFRVKVIQPSKLIPGNVFENYKIVADIISHQPLECDLIIFSFGCISGCTKIQSLVNMKILRDSVDKAIKNLNQYISLPVIINDITGLYYLIDQNPIKIESNKIRLSDKATIRFIDNDWVINSTPIQEIKEDLIVLYDTTNRSFLEALTKANGNNALWISSCYEDCVEVEDTNLLFFSKGIENKLIGWGNTSFDIEPNYHDPLEFKKNNDGDYIVVEVKNTLEIHQKNRLNYFSPEFTHLVSYNPQYCKEVFSKQVRGLENKLKKLGKGIKSIIGVSGGSDSTLALLVTYFAYVDLGWDIKDIIGVSMPCFGTTDRTKNNAKKLIDGLEVTYMEVDIKDPVISHLTSINHSPNSFNSAYENAQARMRMMTLFGLSNDLGGIVIGTGDLSETWLGWCTYGGDDLAGYNPNCRLLKTTVLQIIKYLSTTDEEHMIGDEYFENDIQDVLKDILNTPISPELIQGGNETQKSEGILGPYILHDIFITGICLGWSEARIKKMAELYTSEKPEVIEKTYQTNLKRFSGSQFKRAINVPGPKVGLDNDLLNNINMPTDFIL